MPGFNAFLVDGILDRQSRSRTRRCRREWKDLLRNNICGGQYAKQEKEAQGCISYHDAILLPLLFLRLIVELERNHVLFFHLLAGPTAMITFTKSPVKLNGDSYW
jgi:hypothetical protein